MIRVGFFGTRGVPASYSGFETFYDKLLKRLPKNEFEIYVFNRYNYLQYPFKYYKGARVISLPSIPQKHLDTISHTFFSLIYSVSNGIQFDIALICNVGNSLLLPLFRIFGIKTVLNVDGQDWRRQKWEKFASLYLKASEKVAASFADIIVADSLDVKNYYLQNYKVSENRIVYIPYGGVDEEDIKMADMFGDDEKLLKEFGLKKNKYFLFVGRLVPENSPHTLISAFKKAKSIYPELNDFQVSIVGDAPYSEKYKMFLKQLSGGDKSIVFTGYVFSSGYIKLSRNAFCFVLCAQVGGTHPVLVEQMSLGNIILCYDSPSNREVLQDSGFFFDSEDSLKDLLGKVVNHQNISEFRKKAKERAREFYSWDKISSDYAELFRQIVVQR